MKKIILAAFLILGLATVSFATPILNSANDGVEDRSDGRIYSYYQNSGELLFTKDGNTNPVLDVQAELNKLSGYSSVILTETVVGVTAESDGLSGTWATNPSSNFISFYAVKASNCYAFYLVDPADNSGSWSTFDIWSLPHNGNPPGYEISHFVGYNPESVPVPEPGAILLLGAGLLGLAVYGRKRVRK